MDQNFHLIEKYFQGKLDKDELQLFNQKLQQDPSFEQEFRDMKLIRDAVKESSRVRALDILQNAEANLTNQETTKINVSMKRLVSIAASLLIVATVSYFAFSGGTGALTGEEIVATYYKSYPNIVETIERDGRSSVVTTLRAKAYNAYDIKDYSTSANLFENLLESEKIAENYLYSGIANLEAGNLELAKNNLNTALNNFSEFKEQSRWFLAMALFKADEDLEAISNLAYLSMGESSYAEESKSILTKMKVRLTKNNDGQVVDESVIPPQNGGDSPDGTEFGDIRRYQIGTLRGVDNQLYSFYNESPIDGLHSGDFVEYILANMKGKKPMAVILAAK